jgi:hypothetical protein
MVLSALWRTIKAVNAMNSMGSTGVDVQKALQGLKTLN